MLRSGDKCREVIDLAFATAMDFPSHLQTVAFLLNQSEQDREQHVPETGTLQFKLKPRLRLIKLAAPEKRDVNKSVPTATPEITTFISKDPLDLLIQLDSVDLVDIRPQPTGFFVSLAVDSLGAQALVNFVEASKDLIVNALGETDNRRAFVEPFSDPMQHELDVGVDVRVEVKVKTKAMAALSSRNQFQGTSSIAFYSAQAPGRSRMQTQSHDRTIRDTRLQERAMMAKFRKRNVTFERLL
eukprot:2359500-Pleurochrysis_carterae.AAC.2